MVRQVDFKRYEPVIRTRSPVLNKTLRPGDASVAAALAATYESQGRYDEAAKL
jgi:hypothetical protein